MVLPGEADVRDKCAPLLQWATLKMQKAKADEQLLKTSSSNGEWNERRRSIVTDGPLITTSLRNTSFHHILYCMSQPGSFRSSRTH